MRLRSVLSEALRNIGAGVSHAPKYRMRLVRAHMDYITAEINDVDKMIENMISSFVLNIH